MRVLIYAHDWAPSIGGVQTVTMLLARGLARQSSTKAGAPVDTTLVTQTLASGMDDTYLPFRVVRRPGIGKLIELVRASDIIHVANPAMAPLVLGWFFQKPTVLEHDGYQSVCPNGLLIYQPDRSLCPGHFMAGRFGQCAKCNSKNLGWLGSLRNLVLTFPRRWLARRVACNVAPTAHVGRRISLPRTQIIYHGVPSSVSAYSVAGGTDSKPPCFAYVGRLVLEKGLPLLLQASGKLLRSGQSFMVRIIGDGPERQRLEQMTEELGLSSRVQFIGSVPADQTSSLLADAVAVVMPSVWEDIAPLAASEQLMQGNLLIASDIGGLGEIVDRAGLKFRPGDTDALEHCMRQVLESPDLANQLRAKARQRGTAFFSEERMVEEHLQLYRGLLGVGHKRKVSGRAQNP